MELAGQAGVALAVRWAERKGGPLAAYIASLYIEFGLFILFLCLTGADSFKGTFAPPFGVELGLAAG